MTFKYVLHLQKSVDRSWKYFYTVLKSAAIYLYKDKRTAAEVSFSMFLFLKQFIKPCYHPNEAGPLPMPWVAKMKIVY